MSTLRASATTTEQNVQDVEALQNRLKQALRFVKDRTSAFSGWLNLTPVETVELRKILEGNE